MKPLISIIVPVYKVEKYLERCLDSIITQTYPNLEVLLVDDGSPDKCGEICEKYAEKYSNFQVIHQNNQGLAAARNNAVPRSHGDYITFIDSDDFVTSDYVEYLFELIEKYHSDISVGGSVYQYDNKEINYPANETISEFYSVEEALIRMNCGKNFSVTAWGKLYKRELVEENPYPIGKLYEDVATTYKIVASSSGVAFGNKQVYYWIQRPNSIMHSAFDVRQFDGIEAAEKQLIYIQEKYPSAISAAEYRYTAKTIELMAVYFYSGGDKSIYRRIKHCMNKYSYKVCKDSNAKVSMRIRILAVKIGYYPAKIVFYLHDKSKKLLV